MPEGRLSMRLGIPGEGAVAGEAVVAREKDMPRLSPAAPVALPDNTGDSAGGRHGTRAPRETFARSNPPQALARFASTFGGIIESPRSS